MIITVKTLQQKVFKIEIDDSKTVSDLKEKIEETQGSSFPAASLKLIYSGKVLDNDKVISEYNVQETNFMVVMVTKTKKPASTTSSSGAAPEASRPSAQTSTSHTDGGAQESNPQQPSVSITTTSSTTTPTPASTTVTTPSSGSEVQSSATSSAPSATRPATESGGEASGGDAISQANTTLVTGAEYEAAVSRIVDMGFDRSEVEAALSKSFNNPDRAVEYLFSGGPQEEENVVEAPAPPQGGEGGGESPMDVQQPQQPQQQQQSPSQQGSGSRDWLQHPALGQLIQLIRRDPTQLQTVIQQFSQTNPDLVRAISQNPEEFLHAVQTAGLVPGAGGPGPQGGPGLIPGGPPGGARGATIQVTPEEKEAIDRLKSMGFPEAMAIQAYFACDKNEELAANFLLSDNDFNSS